MLMLIGGSLPAASYQPSYQPSPTKTRPRSPPRIVIRVQLALAWAGGCLPLHRRRGGHEGVGGMWAAWRKLGGGGMRGRRRRPLGGGEGGLWDVAEQPWFLLPRRSEDKRSVISDQYISDQ